MDPIAEANLVEPVNGERTHQDSDEESDNDYEEWQMNEPAFKEHSVGGAESKGPPREKRTPRQIIESCEKLRRKYEVCSLSLSLCMSVSVSVAVYLSISLSLSLSVRQIIEERKKLVVNK